MNTARSDYDTYPCEDDPYEEARTPLNCPQCGRWIAHKNIYGKDCKRDPPPPIYYDPKDLNHDGFDFMGAPCVVEWVEQRAICSKCGDVLVEQYETKEVLQEYIPGPAPIIDEHATPNQIAESGEGGQG